MLKATSKQSGNEGEELASRHLQRMGFQIIEMNFRFGHGEIDIIARDGDVLVFCEVKTRKTDEYGDPAYAITPRKQQQIRKIAQGYLYEHEIKEHLCRFDVVTIQFKNGAAQVEYYRNAF